MLQNVCSTRRVEHANFITRPSKITRLLNFVEVIQSGPKQRVNVEYQVTSTPSYIATGSSLVCFPIVGARNVQSYITELHKAVQTEL